jgi:hypothetical protein
MMIKVDEKDLNQRKITLFPDNKKAPPEKRLFNYKLSYDYSWKRE